MPIDNSPARRETRRAEAIARNEANRAHVISCKCGGRHHVDWSGCALKQVSA